MTVQFTTLSQNTDTAPPRVVAVDPYDGNTAVVSSTTMFNVWFDENVKVGAGSISKYDFIIPAGLVTDMLGNQFPGQNTTAGVVQQDFTCVAADVAGPTLAASPFTPGHETDTPLTYSLPVSSSFLFQFNENIMKNAGSITMASCPQCTSPTVAIDVMSSSVVVKG